MVTHHSYIAKCRALLNTRTRVLKRSFLLLNVTHLFSTFTFRIQFRIVGRFISLIYINAQKPNTKSSHLTPSLLILKHLAAAMT